MRIAIMGSGGVGGYFGGLLARAGEEVTFIARGAHLTAIREHGLQIVSVHGDFIVAPAQATDRPDTVGPVDYVLFATKTYHIESAAEAMRPLIGPRTTVLPLQNGVDAAERVAAIIGHSAVIGGLCYVGSHVAAPGVIQQVSQFRRVIAGELPTAKSSHGTPITPRVEAIVAALQRAGATAEATTDIDAARWTKFAFIAPFSGVAAVTRVPAGEVIGCPEARQLLEQAVREVATVARARRIALDPDIVAQTMTFCDNLPPTQMASMQRDILDGRPSELDSLIGVMVRYGDELGIPVPTFRFFHAALLPLERRAQARGAQP